MVLLGFEAQTFIFAVLYQKNQSFQPKVLYCTKKTKKNNVSRPLAEDQPGSDQLSWPQDRETYAFLVQYSIVGQKDYFFATVQQKLRFELQKPITPEGFMCFSRWQTHFIGTVQQNWCCVEKITKTICFHCFL